MTSIDNVEIQLGAQHTARVMERQRKQKEIQKVVDSYKKVDKQEKVHRDDDDSEGRQKKKKRKGGIKHLLKKCCCRRVN